MTPKVVERYLAFGLAMDRHIAGFVDAYYGPKAIAERVHAAPGHVARAPRRRGSGAPGGDRRR